MKGKHPAQPHTTKQCANNTLMQAGKRHKAQEDLQCHSMPAAFCSDVLGAWWVQCHMAGSLVVLVACMVAWLLHSDGMVTAWPMFGKCVVDVWSWLGMGHGECTGVTDLVS